ncbi:MAG: hypothetical protein E7534_06805 [Ruminococcaceae bacterium]|nr:hypothetical protein [Oscillospiraceae bacterium]
MKEFFGFGGYTRTPEGFLSWQHLLLVGSLLCVMTVLAIVVGRRNKLKTPKEKNRVLAVAAPLIVGLELTNITILCFRTSSTDPILHNLPFFLCSIQFITIPLAAYSKGRLKEAAIDFVCIFGILGAVFGMIGAGQNYNAYPVLSWDNVVSGLTHSISGFSSLYIMISGYASMKKRNIGISFGILLGFCVAAYIANVTIPYNYMFLMRGDGTPYDILYNLVNGNPVLYPLGVVALFLIYISVFYWVFYMVRRKKNAK